MQIRKKQSICCKKANSKLKKIFYSAILPGVKKTTVTPQTVAHIAQLANIPVSKTEQESLAHDFEETLVVVDELSSLDVSQVKTTHQVTGLENVWRADEVNQEVMFTQQEALFNAELAHDGYFVVPRILEEKDA